MTKNSFIHERKKASWNWVLSLALAVNALIWIALICIVWEAMVP